jgi:hypothetical protein
MSTKLRFALALFASALTLTGLALSLTFLENVAASGDTREAASTAPPRYPLFWRSSVIHDAPRVGSYSSVLDSAGRPHVAFGQDALYHAYNDGTEWQVERVDPASGQWPTQPAIAVHNEEVHIAYIKDFALWYAYWNGASWSLQELETGYYAGTPSIAVENQPASRPHIVYASTAKTGLGGPIIHAVRHVWFDGATWNSEPVETPASGSHITLKLAPTSPFTAQVTYLAQPYPSENNPLYYRYAWKAGDWYTETLGATTSQNRPPPTINMDLIPAAPYTPVVIYPSDFLSAVGAMRSSSGWISLSLPPGYSSLIGFVGPAIESSAPYSIHVLYTKSIVYPNEVVHQFDHYWGDGYLWQTAEVSRTGQLLLNSTPPHTPTVVFGDQYGDLVYGALTGTDWSLISNDGVAGIFNRMAIAPTEPYTTHIAYVYHRQLYYAQSNGGAWSREIIGPVGSPWESGNSWVAGEATHGQQVALTLAPQTSFQPCVSYHDFSANQLMYGCAGPSGWTTETVAADGWAPALAFEPASPFTPHVSYIDRSNALLVHAWREPGGWLTETVEHTGYDAYGAFYATALAIAPSAPYTLQIGYYDSRSDTINYAWRTSTQWLTATVDSMPGMREKMSLALEPDPPYTPHLAYMSNRWQVRHAWLKATGWQTETVAGSFDLAPEAFAIALALEPTPPYHPYIAYSTGRDGYLARRQSNGWFIQQWGKQNSDYDPKYNSLAIMPTYPYTPLVSYQNFFSGDLVLLAGEFPPHVVFLPSIHR